jgi:hypothetical protein
VIDRVVIQIDEDGQFPNAALCAAFLGFRARGRDVCTLNPTQIEELPATPDCLVFGDVNIVRDYLARLGCTPTHLDYPSRLRPFMGRRVDVDVLSVIRRRYNEPGPPVFIKPVHHKLFLGQVVSRFGDLIVTSHLDATTLVYCVEYVEFLSEWRVYCRDGQAVGIGHYRGDPFLFPDADVVHQALHAFAGYDDMPRACALDFGRVRDGRTLLVEVNDMISLGSYGLDARLYSDLIEHRWDQLVEGCTPQINNSGEDHRPEGS